MVNDHAHYGTTPKNIDFVKALFFNPCWIFSVHCFFPLSFL
jgi:hypothetical protein